MSILRHATRLVPGILLCAVVTLAASLLQMGEERVLGRPYLEALVLAILLGTAIRSLWTPAAMWRPGIAFSAKMLLEVAVMLLGASISLQTLLSVGPGLLLGIAGVVAVAILVSYAIGRTMGLPQRMAILIACGNSICGNSAIAAVAPVIGADSDDIASSIAFTAVLGVIVVLSLPLLIPLIDLSATQYGVLAGLTVYAVPQVLAATVPAGLLSTQIGTLVKLVRVLMLGPVVLLLSLGAGRLEHEAVLAGALVAGEDIKKTGRFALSRLVPWFIIGFLAMGGLRSADLLPHAILAPAATLANLLTVLAMAALGLGVDVRVVARAGGRVTATVVVSLLVLMGISFALIRMLGIA
ncbi:MAG TPA: putative sulfate exporter family transporter [Stellaceae bacterium]|nr:putative sulfate exporter family transporter [Stellaceae bacterium]